MPTTISARNNREGFHKIAGVASPPDAGYRIVHRFQLQDENEKPTTQYVDIWHAASWEEIEPIVGQVLQYPEGSGFTVSITVEIVTE